MDFLVIGAGINGLLLARELAIEGAQVQMLDKGACCQEASWAGGGIVSPLYPWRYRQPVTALASWAQDFYPRLAVDLHQSTGIDPEFSQTGLLMLDAEDEAEALQWARLNKRCMERIDQDFIYHHEPKLAAGFQAGLWMPDVANIRNPRLGQALMADLMARPNVSIREKSQVTQFENKGRRIRSVVVQTGGGESRFAAENIVLCAGAWSGQLAELTGIELKVEPVKGQMLLYRFQRPPVKSIVLTRGRYAIPRRDGHLLVGSTLEYEHFDKTPTIQARSSLMASAQDLLPVLKGAEPVAQWAGLRPAAPDGVPYIGRLPGYENFYVNAGQFRNGLVLAPASARLLTDLMLQRNPIIDPSPYQPISHQSA